MNAEIKTKPHLTVIKEERIAHLLLPGEVGAILELTVKDKQGKVTDHRVMKSESFVRQFLELLWVEFNKTAKGTPLAMMAVDGFARGAYENKLAFGCNAGIGVVTNGIIVGTGITAPTINDYEIETLIEHDAAPPTVGSLQYSGVTFGAPASDAATSQFTITRNFANSSGGAITVNEIALYSKGYSTYNFMTIRDVIALGIAVPDGQTLTINYRLQAAV